MRVVATKKRFAATSIAVVLCLGLAAGGVAVFQGRVPMVYAKSLSCKVSSLQATGDGVDARIDLAGGVAADQVQGMSVDFGDGTPPATATPGKTMHHPYASSGLRTVTAHITPKQGSRFTEGRCQAQINLTVQTVTSSD